MKIEDVRVGMRVIGPRGTCTVSSIYPTTGPHRPDLVRVQYDIDHVYGAEWDVPVENVSIAIPSGAYSALRAILDEALTRASEGKGKDRHANGKPFDEQPIVGLNLSLGSQDGPLFQIMKKCQEASRFYASGERERAENELLDCIVYAAGAVITGRRRE